MKPGVDLLEDGRTSLTTADICMNVLSDNFWRTGRPRPAERWPRIGDTEWSWTAMDVDHDCYLQKRDIAQIIPNGVGNHPEDLEMRGARDEIPSRRGS